VPGSMAGFGAGGGWRLPLPIGCFHSQPDPREHNCGLRGALRGVSPFFCIREGAYSPRCASATWITAVPPLTPKRRLAGTIATSRFDRETGKWTWTKVDADGKVFHGREHFDRFRHELRARYVLRKRREGGPRVAPPPVMRPLVLAAPRERRESRRSTRRTAATRGDPDDPPQPDDLDRRHGAPTRKGAPR
jgi:hypothetical protein